MAKRKVGTKSIINIQGTTTYNNEEMVNIFNTFSIGQGKLLNVSFFDEYIIENGDRWDLLSFKFYNTTQLWWVLAKYNTVKDPFTELVVGEQIKIIKPSLVSSLILSLREI